VEPDEAVTIELPSESGYRDWKNPDVASIMNPGPGVAIASGGNVEVNLAQFLEGAKTSMILRIHCHQ